MYLQDYSLNRIKILDNLICI